MQMSGIYYSSVQVPVICWPLGEAESIRAQIIVTALSTQPTFPAKTSTQI